MPSRPHFSQHCIPALYESLKNNVKTSLSQADRVAMTTDSWTSCSNQSYITITSHFIDCDWKLKTFVLQTRVMHEAHTGKNIGQLLRDACVEWSITDPYPALVTDNARNMVVAGQEAKSSPHLLCFAHTLNLSSQKGLGVNGASRLLGKVRKIVGYFHRSPHANHVLQEKQSILELPCHKLIQDVITRWNSSFDMLERFLEQQSAIVATFMSKDLRKGVVDISLLTDQDIVAMEDIVKLMEPMKMATTVMCEEDQPTISVVAPLRAKLLNHLQPCDEDTTLVAEMKRVMLEDFSSRYKGIEETLNKAAALDPRFKELPYLEKDVREVVFANLALEATQPQNEMLTEQGSSSSDMATTIDATNPDEPPQKKKAMDVLFGDSFAQKQVMSKEEKAREEITKGHSCGALMYLSPYETPSQFIGPALRERASQSQAPGGLQGNCAGSLSKAVLHLQTACPF
ncbi:hypothetical protein WMY93_013922 [Mugilogobius chulae]|uniref:Uncharacterized protein n=1 Tax=Mugilogobius chulae TaxID=88201 RepID=A0AAW0PDP7_9GOBI